MGNRRWTDEDLVLHCKNSKNKTEVLKKLGLSFHNSGNYQTVDRYIKSLEIDISHFEPGVSHNAPRTKIDLNDILIENSTYTKSAELKSRLVKDGYLKYECVECKNSTWNNKSLNLQLDHINGISNDNRIKNLRLLCPNCHSQTETFCRGTRRRKEKFCIECNAPIQKRSTKCFPCGMKSRPSVFKIEWPDIDALSDMVDRLGYSEAGRNLGISDNAIRKRLKSRKGII